MFGEWGTLILQFVITAVVVLGLVATVYWLGRRYSAGGLGRIGRGRVPRLAIIDALSVDGRRRLVLVRRDNVEHLILIGGPSDLVVEQAIQRPRRPKAAMAEPDAVPPPPPALEPTAAPENQPIPFPQPRSHQSAAQNGAQTPSQSAERPFSFRRTATGSQPAVAAASVARQQPLEEAVPLSPARFVDVGRPTRIEPASTAAQFREMPEAEALFPELPTAELPLPAEEAPAAAENSGDGVGQPRLDLGDGAARSSQTSPFARPAPRTDDDTAAKVNDLEREMARLLGEITQKRPS